jgi:hypothetical protein
MRYNSKGYVATRHDRDFPVVEVRFSLSHTSDRADGISAPDAASGLHKQDKFPDRTAG